MGDWDSALHRHAPAHRTTTPAADRLYFNIKTMGNTSSASIPIAIAIADAVAEQVIDRPMWIFAPGFGAGAVAGYGVLRIDPAVVAPTQEPDTAPATTDRDQPAGGAVVPHASEDIATAFGV